MRGKLRFFSLLLTGVGVLFLFTLCPNHAFSSGSDIQLNWDKPHYFVGKGSCPAHIEYGTTAPDYPTAYLNVWYAGEHVIQNIKINYSHSLGGWTTATHRTRSHLKATVKLYNPWGGYAGEATYERDMNFGHNYWYVVKNNVYFRINFYYPQPRPGDGTAKVYMQRNERE